MPKNALLYRITKYGKSSYLFGTIPPIDIIAPVDTLPQEAKFALEHADSAIFEIADVEIDPVKSVDNFKAAAAMLAKEYDGFESFTDFLTFPVVSL